MRGVLHVHTAYSRDSEISIEDLHERCLAEGLEFALVADHYEDMTEEEVASLICECEERSDEVKVIPGVEVAMKKIHLLLYGLKVEPDLKKSKKIGSRDIRRVRRENPKLVIGVAHFGLPELNLGPEEMDFVEIWNYKYDGVYPDFQKLRSGIRKSRKGCLLGGLDIHRLQNIDKMHVIAREDDPLTAIKNKRISTVSSVGILDCAGEIHYKNSFHSIAHLIIYSTKKLSDVPKSVFSGTGRNPPNFLSELKRNIIG